MRSAEFSVLPFAAIDHDRREDSFCGVEGRASFSSRARVEAEVTGAASVNVVNEDAEVVAAGALTLGIYLEVVEDLHRLLQPLILELQLDLLAGLHPDGDEQADQEDAD